MRPWCGLVLAVLQHVYPSRIQGLKDSHWLGLTSQECSIFLSPNLLYAQSEGKILLYPVQTKELTQPAIFWETYHVGKSFAPNLDQTFVLDWLIIHCNLVENIFIQLRKTMDRRESAHFENHCGTDVKLLRGALRMWTRLQRWAGTHTICTLRVEHSTSNVSGCSVNEGLVWTMDLYLGSMQ